MSAEMANAQEILMNMVSHMRMSYGIEMQKMGMRDLDIALVHLQVARSMETWAENNLS